MKLHSLKINGYRRIESAEILFGDATFLIGPNNSGKSTILKAIELLLSGTKQVPSQDYYSVVDLDTGETKPGVKTIVLEAEFRQLPTEAQTWRGFKGRVFRYTPSSESDTGLSVTYRKTFELGSDVVIEFKSKERTVLAQYRSCKTPQDYIDNGVAAEDIQELFPDLASNIAKSKTTSEQLELLDAIWEVNDSETWFKNPGGILGNVLKMLPRFLLIPADTSSNEIEGASSGLLGKTLSELFTDVRLASNNYSQAQNFLNELAKELDPQDKESEFGKMLGELNAVLASVFPDSKLHARASLNDPNTALKPTFTVEMSSNVRTPVSHQGSGMVRAAAFGMLRFRQKWVSRRAGEQGRALIVCFEEPELYLHPSAANQMRNTVYDLSESGSQIVATTHSPFLIDLAQKPRQVLNCLRDESGSVLCKAFNVTDEFQSLQNDSKSHVKMLQRVDDHMARIFFTKYVVVVEGDTEEVAIRESLRRLPREKYLRLIADFEVMKARGKASIIGVVKYLTAMGIEPIVVHDRDQGIDGAEVFNEHIANALAGRGRIVLMRDCVEDEMEYSAPSSEKPYTAYKKTEKWGSQWDELPARWRQKMEEVFGDYVKTSALRP
jgi:putative ATP-dependent endonuclease of the OLD family